MKIIVRIEEVFKEIDKKRKKLKKVFGEPARAWLPEISYDLLQIVRNTVFAKRTNIFFGIKTY